MTDRAGQIFTPDVFAARKRDEQRTRFPAVGEALPRALFDLFDRP